MSEDNYRLLALKRLTRIGEQADKIHSSVQWIDNELVVECPDLIPLGQQAKELSKAVDAAVGRMCRL